MARIKLAKVILIADSGSTKCNWKLISRAGGMKDMTTTGINPFFRTTESIHTELINELLPSAEETVEHIFFYGSGIVNEEKADIIRIALQDLFQEAKIELFSDVLAASRSLFGTSEGIACILGTGSNACLYDGKQVTAGISPLGFILGDEGSGAVLGKKLLGDYFKEVMPEVLRTKFENKYHLTRDEALQRVYKTERPNHFLASFAPFLSGEISTEYCQHLVRVSLTEFFERNVKKIPSYKSFPIGFVGSIAFHFRNIVNEICDENQMHCVSILQDPMEGLVKYHLKQNF
jgi:N-acetylglucosamine kinase-like BadF-type ATPase